MLAAGPQFKPIATNPMGAPLMATPALSQGVMYVRTSMSLVAVGPALRPSSEAERARRGLADDRPKNFLPWTEGGATASNGVLTLTITSSQESHAAFAGTWRAEVPGVQTAIEIRIRLDAAGLSGELISGPAPLKLIEGAIGAGRIDFKVVAPTGDRTIAFSGSLHGDQLAFTRTVRVHDGGAPGGVGIFGARGAPSFVAKRVGK